MLLERKKMLLPYHIFMPADKAFADKNICFFAMLGHFAWYLRMHTHTEKIYPDVTIPEKKSLAECFQILLFSEMDFWP